MRPHKHRKLTDGMLMLLRSEARKRAQLSTYEYLALYTGLSIGTVKQLMAELIREEREGKGVVRRGTNKSSVDELLAELRA